MKQISLNVYYRLPGAKLAQYLVDCDDLPMVSAIDHARMAVQDTIPHNLLYNLAVLAVVKGGKA